MNVEFAIPDVIQHERVCCECGQPWRVYCAFGAEEPACDRFYRCPDCRTPPLEATPERVERLTVGRAQLLLVKDDERG